MEDCKSHIFTRRADGSGIKSPPECGRPRESVAKDAPSRNELSKKQKGGLSSLLRPTCTLVFVITQEVRASLCSTSLSQALISGTSSCPSFLLSFLFPSVSFCEPKLCLPGPHILRLRVVLALVVPHEEVTPAGPTRIHTQKGTETGNMTGNGGGMSETECTTTGDVGGAGVHQLMKVCRWLPCVPFSLKFGLAGRKRRRSMSPYDRERYDPRPRYSDDYGLNT